MGEARGRAKLSPALGSIRLSFRELRLCRYRAAPRRNAIDVAMLWRELLQEEANGKHDASLM